MLFYQLGWELTCKLKLPKKNKKTCSVFLKNRYIFVTLLSCNTKIYVLGSVMCSKQFSPWQFCFCWFWHFVRVSLLPGFVRIDAAIERIVQHYQNFLQAIQGAVSNILRVHLNASHSVAVCSVSYQMPKAFSSF